VKYGVILRIEITAHIPVGIPDTLNLLSSLKQSGGIIKERNYPHLSWILTRIFYRIFVRKQILKQNLQQNTCWL